MSSEIVAEYSAICRSLGVASMIAVTSSKNPIDSISSASSRQTMSHSLSTRFFRRM